MDTSKDVVSTPTDDGGVRTCDGDPMRDTKGRFGMGNKASVGQTRSRTKCVMLREAALGSATLEMAIQAMEKLHALGMEGDVKALVEWLNRIGCRPELMGMDDEQMEDFAIRIIERVWGPGALKNTPSDASRN